ncbi:phosphonatase-like hydrolase [Mucilaginibacter mallensis]|uniref:Phosphonatase-like hydrolase n=1 Tax=Mucilaginibacter mallensis TaxID=652787 RepID=A0A1H1T016_MUCMA|nr:HAD-IA family hydrolase [Mucilaginibacter mallensis]SDS53572.1 phosphonatase-like hydrolase [Mucilaginibacter mallensis]
MSNIRMVVFDMAGTTVDEDNIVYKTLQKAINEAGFDISLNQVLAEGAGKEKLQAIKSILSVYADNHDMELANGIFKAFLIKLAKAYEINPVYPQPHAAELFEELKKRNILVVLNTGYDRATAQSLIEKLGWQEGTHFDGLITATDVSKNRPDPDMIELAMKRFNITAPSSVVKVGDSIIDIEEGRNAHCGLSIGITTGAHTPEQLASAHPDNVINDLMELLPLVN